MPSKPAKYGIKIFWLCDSFMSFTIDGIMYLDKQPGEAILSEEELLSVIDCAGVHQYWWAQ